jgi:uncharacterized Zn finger protein
MTDHERNTRAEGPSREGGMQAGPEPAPLQRPRGRASQGWWVGRWMRALGNIFDATRLAAGRALAQEGKVLGLEPQLGLVTARVRADAPDVAPYRVHLSFATYDDAQWQRIIHLLGQRAIYAAQLMNDEMPEEIEGVFRAAGVSLFPANLAELGAECTCSDWASTCKHRAAVCYALGDWLDRDPFLLFALRGRTREEVIAALRAQRASQAAGGEPYADAAQSATMDPKALPADPERFWELGADLDVVLHPAEDEESEPDLLAVLGELPVLQDDETRQQLEAVYREVAQRAQDVVNGRDEESKQRQDD